MLRFKNILFYLDHDPGQSDIAAFRETMELARDNGAALTVLTVVAPRSRWFEFAQDGPSPADQERLALAEKKHFLDAFIADHALEGVSCQSKLLSGKPETETVKEVIAAGHDLVIKAAKGDWEHAHPIGSLDKTLIRYCPCPVWLLKSEQAPAYNNVLAAIDVEDHDNTHASLNRTILELSSSLCQRKQVQLHVVAGWDLWLDQPLRRRAGEYEIDDWLQAKQAALELELKNLLKECGIDPATTKIHMERGLAARVIEDVADRQNIDLLVMGTISRTGIAGMLLGNTAETLLSRARHSILAVKPEGFRSPISVES